ncbi:MAG: PrsW family intramembrane metalloprotease [Ancrocorticia sp.]
MNEPYVSIYQDGSAPQVSYQAPRWKEPRRHGSAYYAGIAVLIAVAVAGFFYTLPLISFQGRGVTLMLAILALVPVALVLWVIRWIDQWEPEPVGLYLVAFGWGAGVSALMAIIGNFAFESAVSSMSRLDDYQQATLPVVVGAPLIEEAVKGLGVLLLFFAFARYFNGPVDGLVYGMLIGLGFAFTENIFYFGQFYDELAAVFRARAIESPFVHPFCTALTGMFVGMATNRSSSLAVVPLAIAGYSCAVFLHGLHNFSAVQNISSVERFAYQLPIYVGAIYLVIFLRRRERERVTRALMDYADAGWITVNEIAMIQTIPNRQAAVAWAGPQAQAMRRFQAELIELGNVRSRNLHRVSVHLPHNRAEEARRLQLLNDLRAMFVGGRGD